jgi:N-carbamoylputrescine amidase
MAAMLMRVTVCQLGDPAAALLADWKALVAHVHHEKPQLVLLPELPFHPWIAWRPAFEPAVWTAAVAAHEAWKARLVELAPAAVVTTLPVDTDGQRLNEAVLVDRHSGPRAIHAKRHLPDEKGAHEARWFDRGPGRFDLASCGDVRFGVLICSELWFFERARAYGRGGAQLLLVPRASMEASLERWRLAGRVAAISAGAYCLSSNRVGASPDGSPFGGQGWVFGPDGDVLGVTSAATPFVTVDVDLAVAEHAKTTYPRSLPE